MTKTCGKCDRKIRVGAIGCCDSPKWFHGSCVNPPLGKEEIEALTELKKAWRCSECILIRRRSMMETSVQEGNIPIDEIFQMFSELKENMKTMEKNLGGSIEHLYNKLDESLKVINQVQQSDEKIEQLTNENLHLTTKLSEMEKKVDEIFQQQKTNTLEIHGIPEKSNEDTLQVVKDVAAALSYPLQDNMIH